MDAATVEPTPAANAPAYRRLTRSDLAVLLKLHKDGLTQSAIAQRLGCNQPTVSKWLSQLADTTDIAKEYLRGSALKMSKNIVANGLPRDHVATLKGIGVLHEDQAQGFTVNIGIADSTVSLTLSPPALRPQSEGE